MPSSSPAPRRRPPAWPRWGEGGIERHLVSIANRGVMAAFIGILTDSLPRDLKHAGGIVQDICSTNALRFFGMEGKV